MVEKEREKGNIIIFKLFLYQKIMSKYQEYDFTLKTV